MLLPSANQTTKPKEEGKEEREISSLSNKHNPTNQERRRKEKEDNLSSYTNNGNGRNRHNDVQKISISLKQQTTGKEGKQEKEMRIFSFCNQPTNARQERYAKKRIGYSIRPTKSTKIGKKRG